MIAWPLILAAGVLTGLAVVVASVAVRRSRSLVLGAAAFTAALIVAWRAAANAAGLNDDFVPFISVGDCGCLVAGGLGPALIAPDESGSFVRRAIPVLVAGVAAFCINVVIL